MAVTVLLFASARERAGGAERVVVQTPCGDSSSSDTAVSVAAVVAALREMHPQLGPVLDTCMYAVDMEYVDAATALVEAGGELAVIPPVSGG
ncbi:hypothetical protein HDU84_002114 [Entophlyctis sp. JEL0112]|nr:hypothetical protein HDU84_002114 [Entophlyctis sp. JEL0112]